MYLEGEYPPDGEPEECGRTYTTGGNDPYGTECELPPGHPITQKHEGPNPFGVEGSKVKWFGGGMCAGDPLPYREVEFVDRALAIVPLAH